MTGTLVAATPATATLTMTRWRRVVRFVRTEPLGAAGLALIAVFVLAAIFAPLLTQYGPTVQNREHFKEPPSTQFWFGTDELGRDIFSRVLYGARTSLIISVATVIVAGTIGTLIGIVSGYFGGRLADTLLQRVMDGLMAIPNIVLLLFVASLLGPSVRNTVIALTLVVVPSFNRVVRGEMLRIREEAYVEAARTSGSSLITILFKHGLRNMFGPVVVVASLSFASVLIAEASLSYLGIGTPPPTPSWGRMLADGTSFMLTCWWMVLFPGLALMTAVLAFNLLGDAFRDYFDPRRRR